MQKEEQNVDLSATELAINEKLVLLFPNLMKVLDMASVHIPECNKEYIEKAREELIQYSWECD